MAEVFATGIQMGESPRWHDGRFWMCDWMAGEVLVFDADGDSDVVARVEGLPFSIDWLPDGRLVATHAARVGGRAGPGAVWRGRAALQRNRRGCRWPGVGGHAGLDAVGGAQAGEPSFCPTAAAARSPTTYGFRTGCSSWARTRSCSPSRTRT